ncbi:MAG: hypothetical protein Q7S00_02030 [bacterium]|nr:hypothetical protein [bacterium]
MAPPRVPPAGQEARVVQTGGVPVSPSNTVLAYAPRTGILGPSADRRLAQVTGGNGTPQACNPGSNFWLQAGKGKENEVLFRHIDFTKLAEGTYYTFRVKRPGHPLPEQVAIFLVPSTLERAYEIQTDLKNYGKVVPGMFFSQADPRSDFTYHMWATNLGVPGIADGFKARTKNTEFVSDDESYSKVSFVYVDGDFGSLIVAPTLKLLNIQSNNGSWENHACKGQKMTVVVYRILLYPNLVQLGQRVDRSTDKPAKYYEDKARDYMETAEAVVNFFGKYALDFTIKNFVSLAELGPAWSPTPDITPKPLAEDPKWSSTAKKMEAEPVDLD